jgi:hypothetical protein
VILEEEAGCHRSAADELLPHERETLQAHMHGMAAEVSSGKEDLRENAMPVRAFAIPHCRGSVNGGTIQLLEEQPNNAGRQSTNCSVNSSFSKGEKEDMQNYAASQGKRRKEEGGVG